MLEHMRECVLRRYAEINRLRAERGLPPVRMKYARKIVD